MHPSPIAHEMHFRPPVPQNCGVPPKQAPSSRQHPSGHVFGPQPPSGKYPMGPPSVSALSSSSPLDGEPSSDVAPEDSPPWSGAGEPSPGVGSPSPACVPWPVPIPAASSRRAPWSSIRLERPQPRCRPMTAKIPSHGLREQRPRRPRGSISHTNSRTRASSHLAAFVCLRSRQSPTTVTVATSVAPKYDRVTSAAERPERVP
jgi:hypothetical protein